MTDYQLCIEVPTPGGNNPTHRMEYGDPVESLDEAIAWIKKPPRTLTLREGYLLTARYKDPIFAEMMEDGSKRHITRVAAFRQLLSRTNIILCTEHGITGKGELPAWTKTDWLTSDSGVDMLKEARNVSKQLLVFAACATAMTVIELVKNGDRRPIDAIKKAEAWCLGEATLDDVRSARAAVEAAAAAYTAAAYVDDAPTCVDDAYAVAEAASYAAAEVSFSSVCHYAANAAAYASVAASQGCGHYKSKKGKAARIRHLAMSAKLVRKTIKLPDVCFAKLVCQ